MSIKRETLLFGILCLFTTIPAFAESDWLIVQTDMEQYHTGDTMEISGLILDAQMPQIAIKIYDPDGEILGAYSVELEFDDSFTKTVSLDSPFYDKSGLYTIEFEYGQEADDLFFEVIGNAPEESEPQPIAQLAPEVLMVITDKDTYSDNEFITISGLVSDIGDPTILIGIFDPNDFPAGFYTPQVNSDLEFSVSFLAKNGINFKKPGTYSVKAHYGQSKQVTMFSFVNSPPPQAPSQNDDSSNDSENDLPPPQPQIIVNPAPKPENPPTIQKTPKPEPKPQPVIANISPSIKQETPQEPENNLSVQDVEIGEILNEITLSCDNSRYSDSIVYGAGMGPALMRLCNYDQAISYFDDALVKDPNNVEFLTDKGIALAKLGQFRKSIEHYNTALGIQPDYTPALINKANALAETGKLEDAITIYNHILDDDPSHTLVQKNLQEAREETIKIAKKQQKQETQSVSINLDDSIPKMEPPKSDEEQKPKNVIEQIGNFFAGVFGFLK